MNILAMLPFFGSGDWYPTDEVEEKPVRSVKTHEGEVYELAQNHRKEVNFTTGQVRWVPEGDAEPQARVS